VTGDILSQLKNENCYELNRFYHQNETDLVCELMQNFTRGLFFFIDNTEKVPESATYFRITFLLLSLKFVGDTSKNKKKRSTSKSVINYNFKQLHRFVTIVSIDVKVYKVTKIYQQSRDEF
jgi:hypothetical protein